MDVAGIFRNAPSTSPPVQAYRPPAPTLPAVLEIMPVLTDPLDGGWFSRIGTSVILVLGTFGNVMTIAILRLYHSGWSAMNVYLTALVISDTAMLYSAAFPMWMRKVFHFDLYTTHPVMCKGLIWMNNSAAMASSYILAALTVQRALSVVWPHRVNVLCTQGKSTTVVVVIALMCGLTWSHVLFGCQIVQINNGTSARCTVGSQEYQTFWVNYWVTADLFLFCGIPLVLLLISNATLGWKLAVSVTEAQQRFSLFTKTGHKSNRKKKASSVTVTIIFVSIAFIVTTLPLMIYNTIYQDLAAKDESSRHFHYFVYDFFLEFSLMNYAWNFYLYCLTGTKFRQEFLSILLRCCECMASSCRSRPVKEVPTRHVDMSSGNKRTELEGYDDF